MLLTTTINGRKKELLIRDDDYLLDVLRKEGYLSVKRGCDTGACGLCTILLNGSPILSCSTLAARAQGKEIFTIENFPTEAKNLLLLWPMKELNNVDFVLQDSH